MRGVPRDGIPRDACLSLSLMRDGQTIARAGGEISPHFPTSDWAEGVVVAERYGLPIDASLPGGEYLLDIRVHDAATAETLGRVSLPLQLEDQAGPLAPGVRSVPYQADVTFGDQMWLLGYAWQVERQGLARQALALDVWWQALEVMGTNYKVFVHLLREDGASPSDIVAQVDTMPRGWSYPTTLWSRQEIYRDRIVMSLRDAEPGEYRVALGVYRPETGRLRAIDGDGRRVADDRVVLSEVIVVPEAPR